MTLLELFKDLTYGELRDLSLGNFDPDSTESKPDAKSYEQLLSHINLALNSLYKRFFLATGEVIVQQYDHISVYTLERRFAESNLLSSETYRYIMDSVYEPFTDDVLKIEEVYNEGGEKLFLNNKSEPWSLYTPAYNKIQVPFPMFCNTMTVQYRAAHPRVEYTPDTNPANVEIALPLPLKEALLYYVAARSVKSGEGMVDYRSLYEASCLQIEKEGLQIQTEHTNNKFDQRGWV